MGASLAPQTVAAIRSALREGLDVGIVARGQNTAHALLRNVAKEHLGDLVETITMETTPAPTRSDPWATECLRVTADTWTGCTLYATDVTGVRGMSLGLAVAYHLTPAEVGIVTPALAATGGDLVTEPPQPAPTLSARFNAAAHTAAAVAEATAPAARGALAAIRRAWETGSTGPDTPANYERTRP